MACPKDWTVAAPLGGALPVHLHHPTMACPKDWVIVGASTGQVQTWQYPPIDVLGPMGSAQLSCSVYCHLTIAFVESCFAVAEMPPDAAQYFLDALKHSLKRVL